MTNLAAIDLNLLVVLDALLSEGSVTAAGRRLGLSQPAVSNALARLRDLLGDPLLVRSRRGMAATERARELREPLGRALRQVQSMLAPDRRFDPAETTRTFAIAVTDHAELAIVPALAARIRQGAPRARLHVDTIDLASKAERFRALSTGELDTVVALFPAASRPPAGFTLHPLAPERIVVAGRARHPLLAGAVTAAALRRASFVRIGSEPRDLMELWLHSRGVNPVIGVRTPTLVTGLLLASETDLLIVTGERAAQAMARRIGLTVRPLPFRSEPLSLSSAWPDSPPPTPAHAWLAAQIQAAVSGGRRPRAGSRRS